MANTNEFVPRGRPVNASDQEWARELASRIGGVRAAKVIGCSRNALANVIGGMGVYPGTAALLREARVRVGNAAETAA
jgi:hypothetical protein